MPLSPDRLLHAVLSKDLLLDLEDRLKAEAVKAFEMVRDGSGLDQKRARELEGQARFRMMEQGFEEVCTQHGAHRLDGGVIPGTELKIFQPFMRFESQKQGIILGLAAMPDPNVVPIKNKSRTAGVSLNYHLTPRFDFDGKGPKIGDLFGLMLVSRHKAKAGQIEEIAVGVIDSGYAAFLFYEPLEKFLSGKITTADKKQRSSTAAQGSAVKLKKTLRPYVPPEVPKQDEAEKTKK